MEPPAGTPAAVAALVHVQRLEAGCFGAGLCGGGCVCMLQSWRGCQAEWLLRWAVCRRVDLAASAPHTVLVGWHSRTGGCTPSLCSVLSCMCWTHGGWIRTQPSSVYEAHAGGQQLIEGLVYLCHPAALHAPGAFADSRLASPVIMAGSPFKPL